MRTPVAVLALLALGGCGQGSTVGVWQFVVDFYSSSSGPQKATFELTIQAGADQGTHQLVLGNCLVPLAVDASGAALGPVYTCPLEAGVSLPLLDIAGPTVKRGDVLKVSKAAFTLKGDRLAASLLYKVMTSPGDPTLGPEVSVEAVTDPTLGTRVR